MSATFPKYYMYQSDHERWVIAMTDDAGIMLNMQEAGGQAIELKRGGIARKYWVLPSDAFAKVRPILEAVGYTEDITPAPKAANYSVQPAQAMPAPAQPRTAPASACDATIPQSLEKTYTIIEICKRIDTAIRQNFFENIWVKGEITKFSPLKPGDKGIYFSLIECNSNDKKMKLEAKIWLNNWLPIKEKFDRKGLEITKGTVIRAYGKLEFYAGNSQVNLNILDIDENLAEGEFFKRKFEIEQKLIAMGIHDSNRLLTMPILPLRLAVFSNRSAEGWNDFITCLRNSDYPFKITLFTVNVQGRDLEPTFQKAFCQLEQIGLQNFDLGIIVRGGGSITDLDWFNNMYVAKYIAQSPLKFIIGIGHENDRNVLDEIASREKTPTAVAEMLIRKLDEIAQFLGTSKEYMRTQALLKMQSFKATLASLTSACATAVQKKRSDEARQLEQLKSCLRLKAQDRINAAKTANLTAIAQIRDNVRQNLHSHQRALDSQATKLSQAAEKRADENRFALNALTTQLQNMAQTRIDKEHLELQHAASIIVERVQTQKMCAETDLSTLREKLDLLNPQKIFERGFAAISRDSTPLTSIEAINPGDQITIRLLDGRLGATVHTVKQMLPPNRDDP